MKHEYTLDDQGNPVVERDLMKWARWIEAADRKIASDTIGDARVRTMFLGLDYSFGDGPPILFETTILGGTHDGYMDRYTNRIAALAGHDQAMDLVQRIEKPPAES